MIILFWFFVVKVKLGCMIFMDFILGFVLFCNSRNFKIDKQSCWFIFFSIDISNFCDEELKIFLFEKYLFNFKKLFLLDFFFLFFNIQSNCYFIS